MCRLKDQKVVAIIVRLRILLQLIIWICACVRGILHHLSPISP